MTTPPSRIGGRSENGGNVFGWSPATISVRRSITICAASVARIITNIVALRSHSGRTTDAFDDDAGGRDRDDGDGRGDRQRQAKRLQGAVGDHAADHDECALGEVHDAAGVVDDAEADTDQAVDAADGDAGQRDLRQIGQVRHAPTPR